MREIKLTQNKVALVDDEDYESLIGYKWHADKNRNVFYAHGYKMIDGKLCHFIMSRIILDAPKDMQVDHIDGNGLNNQRSNLRIVTNRVNCQDHHYRHRTSKYPGVDWMPKIGKWRARIQVRGVNNHIGVFSNEIDAACAYRVAEAVLA